MAVIHAIYEDGVFKPSEKVDAAAFTNDRHFQAAGFETLF